MNFPTEGVNTNFYQRSSHARFIPPSVAKAFRFLFSLEIVTHTRKYKISLHTLLFVQRNNKFFP